MTRAEHLDNDRLSALIDGSGSEADLVHVAECDQCGTRLEAWRDVVRSVSVAPHASSESREAAIESALAQAGPEGTAEAGTGSAVLDLAEQRSRRRFRIAAAAVPAAAAVALIAGVASTLVSGSGGSPNHQAGTATSATNGVSGSAASGGSAGVPASPSPFLALGDIGSTSQLVAALRSSYGSTGQSQGAAGQGTGNSGSAASGSSFPAPASGAATNPSCTPPAVPGASYVEEATLVWKGTPAVTFVYSDSKDHTAVVEADPACKILVTVKY